MICRTMHDLLFCLCLSIDGQQKRPEITPLLTKAGINPIFMLIGYCCLNVHLLCVGSCDVLLKCFLLVFYIIKVSGKKCMDLTEYCENCFDRQAFLSGISD